jgi:hypothetical protein
MNRSEQGNRGVRNALEPMSRGENDTQTIHVKNFPQRPRTPARLL